MLCCGRQPSNLNKLKQAAALGLDPKLTKAHLPKFPALEDEVHKWIKDMTIQSQERPPVSMAAVCVCACACAFACVCVCVCVCVHKCA